MSLITRRSLALVGVLLLAILLAGILPVHAETSTPPGLVAATVYGATLTLTYDEVLDGDSTPATTAFAVTVGGTDRGIDGVSVKSSNLTLTLASAVTSDDTVTVSYTVPVEAGASPIQDLAGNDAPSFSGQSVTHAASCSELDQPTPVEVEVQAVPIVVESTTDDYFVLYVRHDLDEDTTLELPVAVVLGEEGTTTLAENVAALPAERYRVEKYLVADPADVDGDCIDDIAELADAAGMNPVNPAAAIDLSDGAVAIPDRGIFETLAYNGTFQRETVKVVLTGMDTDRPGIYFMNTYTHQVHYDFLDTVGVDPLQSGLTTGWITYDSKLVVPDGSLGVYYLWPMEPYSFSHLALAVARAHTLLAASMPLLEDNFALYIPNSYLPYLQSDLPSLRESRIPLLFGEDIFGETDFQALNPAEGYGLLGTMDADDRPHPRDVAIYEALPNELPRVAGIISTVPQTPLSHVNLRAVQDGIPNAFIRDALDNNDITSLLGSYVRYEVTDNGWELRTATLAEVEAHYASSRPATAQTPERDLSVTAITPLSEIGLHDWRAFGVKAANVAVLRTLGFPDGTVPDGFAVPFYFYDEFMNHNDFYTRIETMLADPDFQSDFDVQTSELKKLRKDIEDGETPEWIISAIETMNESFSEGINRRYRSSTNNEDLPGFNGAGLYDSKSQKPSEDEKDLAKSLKEVYASLWNFRAFTEREFHRIDHLEAAMGILVHPSYRDELVNGVAVSFNPSAFGTDRGYYVNAQVGEDLVTNPEAHSVPEELLLYPNGPYYVLGTSNQVPPGQLLMSDAQLEQLRGHLEAIHDEFAELYCVSSGERFAMEIEFKITSANILAIKQARPWVFGDSGDTEPMSVTENRPAKCLPIITGIAQVGQTLKASASAIRDPDGLDDVAFSYQWVSNDGNTDTDIQDATALTYEVSDGDAGKTIKVRVTFTDDQENEESLTSAATAVVTAGPNTPATGLPTISGTAEASQTLTADTSGIDDEDGLINVSYTYQWISNDGNTDTDIQDATDSTYTLSDDDVGKTIRVRVSFTDNGYNDESLTSTATAVVAARSNSPATGLPTISGTAQTGQTLTADTSGIDDEDGLANVAYSYQWIWSDGGTDTDMAGETDSTYTVSDDDVGKTIKVRVSFTDNANNQESLTSEATAAVAAQSDNAEEQDPIWSADMLVAEITSVSIGAASSDLFSNIGGSAGLQIQSIWSHIPSRDLRLAFKEGVPDAEDMTLIVGDLSLEFPRWSSGERSFKWTNVDVDWEDGQTIPVRIVPDVGGRDAPTQQSSHRPSHYQRHSPGGPDPHRRYCGYH